MPHNLFAQVKFKSYRLLSNEAVPVSDTIFRHPESLTMRSVTKGYSPVCQHLIGSQKIQAGRFRFQ